jgi:uncharacterized membrane protein
MKIADRVLYRGLLILDGIGLLIALYLTWIDVTDSSALCIGFGGCDIVRASRYSRISGIPVAVLGVIGYLLIGLALYAETRAEWSKITFLNMEFGLSLSGTIYSAYLTYLEIAVIYAICPYCVASATIMVVMLIISSWRLVRLS